MQNSKLFFFLIVLLVYTLTSHAEGVTSTTLNFTDKKMIDSAEIAISKLALSSDDLLSDEFIIYFIRGVDKDKMYLPITQLSSYLLFDIKKTSPEMFEGWFISKERTIKFDVANSTIKTPLLSIPLTSQQAMLIDDELYLESAVLENILPISIDYNQAEQIVKIISKEPLPVETKIQRESGYKSTKRDNIIDRTELYKAYGYDLTPYKIATVPVADVVYSGVVDGQSANRVANNISAIVGMDLFFTESKLYLNSSQGGTLSGRFLARRDILDDWQTYEGKMRNNAELNPNPTLDPESEDADRKLKRAFSMHDVIEQMKHVPDKINHLEDSYKSNFYTPKQYIIGDTNARPANLVSGGTAGRGVFVSNIPVNWRVDFDRIIIREFFQENWDVEVYINNSLYQYKRTDDTGLIEFTDIPLVSGLNIITLKAYGPFGQREERKYEYLLDSTLVKKHKLYYNFSATEDNAVVFGLLNQSTSSNTSLSPNKNPRIVTDLKYGLNNNISALLGFSSVSVNSSDNISTVNPSGYNRINHLTTGFSSTLFGSFLNAVVANQLNTTNRAFQISGSRALPFGYNINVFYENYSNKYVSDTRKLSNTSLKQNLSFRLNGGISLPGLARLAFITTFAKKDFVDGSSGYTFDSNLSTVVKGVNIANRIQRQISTSPNGQSAAQSVGSFLLSKLIAGYSVRANLDYTSNQQTLPQSGSIRAEKFFTGNVLLTGVIQRQLYGQRYNIYNFGLGKIFSKYIVRTNIGFNDSNQQNYTIGFNVSTNIGFDKNKNDLFMSNKSLTQSTTALAHVYYDKNDNKIFDDGIDIPAPNATFSVDGMQNPAISDENGSAYITGLSPYNPHFVELNTSQLENSYSIPTVSNKNIIAHSSIIKPLNIPLVLTGEIEGYIFLQKDDNPEQALSAAEVEIVNAKTNTIYAKTTSKFDGYYLFNNVPEGEYKIRLSKHDLKALKAKQKVVQKVKVDSETFSTHAEDYIVVVHTPKIAY